METVWQTLPFEYQGKLRKAKIKVQPGDVEIAYRVQMDDGYENIFYVEDAKWIEKNIGPTELAEVIGATIENHFE